MSKLRDKPHDDFVGAIIRGYNIEAEKHDEVTCSQILDQIVGQCMKRTGGFRLMFSWDSRPVSQNRIGTIAEVIAAGHVPGLRVDERMRVTRKQRIY